MEEKEGEKDDGGFEELHSLPASLRLDSHLAFEPFVRRLCESEKANHLVAKTNSSNERRKCYKRIAKSEEGTNERKIESRERVVKMLGESRQTHAKTEKESM